MDRHNVTQCNTMDGGPNDVSKHLHAYNHANISERGKLHLDNKYFET